MKKLLLALIISLATLAIVTTIWWLFGWKTEDNPALGEISYYRFFGRVTSLYVDSDRDGQYEALSLFHWTTPHIGPQSQPYEIREDRNQDGNWDTWIIRIESPSNGNPVSEFRVDLDGDGKSDWKFRSSDSMSAYDEIKKKRGF